MWGACGELRLHHGRPGARYARAICVQCGPPRRFRHGRDRRRHPSLPVARGGRSGQRRIGPLCDHQGNRGQVVSATYEEQGLVDGEWSWMHVAGERVDATYDTTEAAEAAVENLAETTSWHRDALRWVEM